MKTFATAEDTYRRVDYDGDGVLEYSPTLAGLYSKGEINLVDRAFALAEFGPTCQPKAGYVFKVLTAQGPGAPGGAKSYYKNGKMTEGYALIAQPYSYDQSGLECFMISSAGVVYERDFGPDTDKAFDAITEFDPTGWIVTE